MREGFQDLGRIDFVDGGRVALFYCLMTERENRGALEPLLFWLSLESSIRLAFKSSFE